MPLLSYLLTKRSMGHYKVMIEEEIKKNLPILLYYLKKLTVDLLALYSLDILYTLLKKKMKVFFNLASNFIK